mgnify:CR=1 FL=1
MLTWPTTLADWLTNTLEKKSARLYVTGHLHRIGHHWRIPSTTGKRQVRHVLIDTNYWKSFVDARLAVPMGDRGCRSLFGAKPETHRLFAEHLTAEYRVKTEGRDQKSVA